ncbi:response regulator transcription factor [Hymenobacter sp. M29]|uniref:Response regulator transcription factor n=1 Tax=Hymenobacter mellowenesis TaxID=3063995 RepID=A0ABT9AH05_9BACT|nr:response regulator transcription factor [Hymenobacter sp. M29]MDO7849158.1 response regulator transcription factor [Hymenobacter sp. M29]
MEPSPNLLRVLVVEDEALIAENLRLTLEDLGYQIPATCYTLAEARAALADAALRPDLVLLDINLGSADPAHSGLALARELGDAGGPPFVFLTAYSDLATIRQATQLRPSGYLIKPVGGPALFAAIQAALEHASYRQAMPEAAPLAPAPDFFFVKLGERTHKLYWREVQRLEASKNYVTLHLADQRVSYPLRGSLTYVLEQLVPEALRPQFLRINRREAINAALITAYDHEHVYCGSDRYENGRTALKQLQELLLP